MYYTMALCSLFYIWKKDIFFLFVRCFCCAIFPPDSQPVLSCLIWAFWIDSSTNVILLDAVIELICFLWWSFFVNLYRPLCQLQNQVLKFLTKVNEEKIPTLSKNCDHKDMLAVNQMKNSGPQLDILMKWIQH